MTIVWICHQWEHQRLSALRDRSAGRFDVTRDEYSGFMAEHSKYAFVLAVSDTVLVLSSGFAGGPGENLRLGFAVNSCTLADPSTFAERLADPVSAGRWGARYS